MRQRRRGTSAALTAFSVIAVLSLAGCFGSSEPSAGVDTSAGPTTAPTDPTGTAATADPAGDASDLTAAQAKAAVAKVASGTGHFLATTTLDGEDYRQWFGTFSAARQGAVVQYSGPAFTLPGPRPDKYVVFTVVRGADVFAATRPKGPLRSCWAHVDPKSPPVDGISPGFPPQVEGLSRLDAITAVSSDEGRATVPLADALAVLDPGTAASMTATQAQLPVDVVLGYEAGVLSSWSIEPKAASDVARKAGLELSKHELSVLAREAAIIEFTDVGQPVSLRFPDHERRVASATC